jgi:hypothetical protein
MDGYGKPAIDSITTEYCAVALAINPRIVSWLAATFGSGAHKLQHSSLIVSKPGCSRQPPHTDIAIDTINGERSTDKRALRRKQRAWEQDVVPLSILVALEPDTYLWVWPGSHKSVWHVVCGHVQPPGAMQSNPQGKRIRLAPGMACVFTGAFVHAGAEYAADIQRPHIRFHTYADVSAADGDQESYFYRDVNSTGLIADYDNAADAFHF